MFAKTIVYAFLIAKTIFFPPTNDNFNLGRGSSMTKLQFSFTLRVIKHWNISPQLCCRIHTGKHLSHRLDIAQKVQHNAVSINLYD